MSKFRRIVDFNEFTSSWKILYFSANINTLVFEIDRIILLDADLFRVFR